MIELEIPGQGNLKLQHLVLDVNGTIATDGNLREGVVKRLASLRDRLEIHLLTADTHGRQSLIDHQLNLRAQIIMPGDEAAQKAAFVEKLGAASVAAIGQGANDIEMLRKAGLGICILSPEGTSIYTLMGADLLVQDIFSALELLEKPMRIVASLRK